MSDGRDPIFDDPRLPARCARAWSDLTELRGVWDGGELSPDEEVSTSWGQAGVQDISSLPITELAAMTHADLVEQTENGARLTFGLGLADFADPARLSEGRQRMKPLLLGLIDDDYSDGDTPRVYIKIASPLVLADEVHGLHCHFSGGQTTPVEALELLRRAGVNESAGMVSVHPTDHPDHWLDGDKRELLTGVMTDLIGLRLQFPPETVLSVSCDEICAPALDAALAVVNAHCVEEGLPSIGRTELPPAMTTRRTPDTPAVGAAPRVAPRSDPGDPLAPPGAAGPGVGPPTSRGSGRRSHRPR